MFFWNPTKSSCGSGWWSQNSRFVDCIAHRLETLLPMANCSLETHNFWQPNSTFWPARSQKRWIRTTQRFWGPSLRAGPRDLKLVLRALGMELSKSSWSTISSKWSIFDAVTGLKKVDSSIALRTDTIENQEYVCMTRSCDWYTQLSIANNKMSYICVQCNACDDRNKWQITEKVVCNRVSKKSIRRLHCAQ